VAARSNHLASILFAAILCPLAGGVCLAGEEEPSAGDGATEPTSGFTFRPHPLPRSRSFAVFDLGVAYRLNEGRGFFESDNRACFSLDLGYMRNLSPKNAVGFSLYGSTDERAERGGIRARYRRWVSPHLGVDATAGMMLEKSGDYSQFLTTPGIIASVGIQAAGLAGVTLETEQIRFSGVDGSDWDWRIGGHLGAGAGVTGAVLLLAGVVAFVTSYH
jgi:hypothetical protein